MDEKLLKKRKQQEFEQGLLNEQEAFQEADIEDSRERDRLQKEGDIAQAELEQQEEQENDDNTRQREYQQEEQQQLEIQQQEFEEQNQENSQVSDQNQPLLERAREFLKEKGHEVDDEGLKGLAKERPQKPSFPLGMFSLAVVKDTLDVAFTASIIGIIFTWIYTIPYFLISFAWTMSRVDRVSFLGKFAMKKIRDVAVKKWLKKNGLEIVPGAQVLPLATFFVVLNHYADTKLVKVFVEAAEMLEGVDFGD